MNYETMIIDHLDEISAGTKKSTELCKAAGVVRMTSASDTTRLDDRDFGLVILKQGKLFRRFHLDSEASTRLSKNSFLRNKNKLTMGAADIAEGRIKAACARFNLPMDGLSKGAEFADSPYYLHTDLGAMSHSTKLKSAQLVKEAKLKKFAIDATENGRPIQRYPINTEDEVKTAAEAVSVKMPVQWFVKAANSILKRADDLGISIDKKQDINIVKHAEISDMFTNEIHKRLQLTGGQNAIDYMDLQKSASEGDLPSVALALEALDFGNKLQFKWGSALLPPALAVFGFPKEANVMRIDDRSVDPQALSEFVSKNKEEVESAIGKAATEGLINGDTELSFNALPAPHRQYLAELFGGSA